MTAVPNGEEKAMNIPLLLKPKNTISYINESNTVRQGIEKMKYHGYTALPVINDDGEYTGTVSEGDFLWHKVNIEQGIIPEGRYTIKDIMRKRNAAVNINASVDELLRLVLDQNFVPVTDDRGMFIGIVTRRDIIDYFYSRYKNEKIYSAQ